MGGQGLRGDPGIGSPILAPGFQFGSSLECLSLSRLAWILGMEAWVHSKHLESLDLMALCVSPLCTLIRAARLN
ncbi:Uncharacterized protein DAT39_018497, partial [Clarias magur]